MGKLKRRHTSFGFLYFLAAVLFVMAVYAITQLLSYWANGWVATH